MTTIEERNRASAARRMARQEDPDWTPVYESWRHGGWYVTNLCYPSGACGCVSRNYEDKKWRIACDPRPFETAPTFKNRDAAAFGERDLIREINASDKCLLCGWKGNPHETHSCQGDN